MTSAKEEIQRAKKVQLEIRKRLPPVEHQEMIQYCIDRFKTFHIFTGDDGRFYESDRVGCAQVPTNHVRCMLARELTERYNVSGKVRAVIVEKVIEAIFLWAKRIGSKEC